MGGAGGAGIRRPGADGSSTMTMGGKDRWSWGAARLALVAHQAQLVGVYWDVATHHMRARETFWSPPHLVIYLGVALAGVAAWGWWLTSGAKLRTSAGPLWGRPYLWAASGPVVQVAAAPIDELWHRVVGPDVSIWSPPHLLGIAGGMLGVLGWLFLVGRLDDTAEQSPAARGVVATFAVLLLAGALFALGEYDHDQGSREPWLYPVLASLLAPWTLMLTRRLCGWRWAGSLVAVGYTGARSGLAWVLSALGFPWMGFPPVIVVAAVILDRAARRGPPALAGALFGLAFTLTDYPLTWTVTGRSWSALEWAGSLALAAAAGAASAGLGLRLGRPRWGAGAAISAVVERRATKA